MRAPRSPSAVEAAKPRRVHGHVVRIAEVAPGQHRRRADHPDVQVAEDTGRERRDRRVDAADAVDPHATSACWWLSPRSRRARWCCRRARPRRAASKPAAPTRRDAEESGRRLRDVGGLAAAGHEHRHDQRAKKLLIVTLSFALRFGPATGVPWRKCRRCRRRVAGRCRAPPPRSRAMRPSTSAALARAWRRGRRGRARRRAPRPRRRPLPAGLAPGSASRRPVAAGSAEGAAPRPAAGAPGLGEHQRIDRTAAQALLRDQVLEHGEGRSRRGARAPAPCVCGIEARLDEDATPVTRSGRGHAARPRERAAVRCGG